MEKIWADLTKFRRLKHKIVEDRCRADRYLVGKGRTLRITAILVEGKMYIATLLDQKHKPVEDRCMCSKASRLDSKLILEGGRMHNWAFRIDLRYLLSCRVCKPLRTLP